MSKVNAILDRDTKHTEGQWHILCRGFNAATGKHTRTIASDSRPDDFGGKLATVGGDGLSEAEVEANAVLIAAAPAMLNALLDIIANLSGPDCFAERVNDSIRRACEAVDKATVIKYPV